jgi:hypothetical protein
LLPQRRRIWNDREIAVIGYPAYDREICEVQDDLFDGVPDQAPQPGC